MSIGVYRNSIMSNLVIKIDTNGGEDALAEFISTKSTDGTKVTRERLDVGDVRVEALSSGEVLVIERKTWADLQSSLRDGRYKEQKARQMRSISDADGKLRVVYAVEGARVYDWKPGSAGNARGGVTPKHVDAAIAMTSVRDGIPVLRSSNTEHTADMILYLAKKLSTGDLSGAGHAVMASASGYAGFVKSSKKRANMDNGTTWQTMLSTITGVSAKKAKCVVDAYGTPMELFSAMNSEADTDGREKLLADIKCGDKRLGKALSKRIYNTLSGTDAN